MRIVAYSIQGKRREPCRVARLSACINRLFLRNAAYSLSLQELFAGFASCIRGRLLSVRHCHFTTDLAKVQKPAEQATLNTPFFKLCRFFDRLSTTLCRGAQSVDKPLVYIKTGSQGRSPRQGLGAVAPAK